MNLLKDSIAGNYKDEKRWISREEFKMLKDVSGYVKYCWSFGCGGRNYLYSAEIEPWKKALHYARVLNDYSLFAEFGINSDGSASDIKKHLYEYKDKYIKWYLTNIVKSDFDFKKLKTKLTSDIAEQKESLRLYLCQALKRANLTKADVDRRLNTQMSSHWFGRSQWQFPSREFYNKMREFLPLQNYDEVYGYFDLLQNLQRLQNLESLQIKQGSYQDYIYEEGDVVYCDPPYENTVQYDSPFNHTEFYDWVASRPYQVFFSSYAISDKRFYKVWQQKNENYFAVVTPIM